MLLFSVIIRILYPNKCFRICNLYLSGRFVWNHLPSVFHMPSSVCPSLMYSWVFLLSILYEVLKLKIYECMLQDPRQFASGDCGQIWRDRTCRYAALGIFRQNHALENKEQLWPILWCVIRFLCLFISSIKIDAHFGILGPNAIGHFCVSLKKLGENPHL